MTICQIVENIRCNVSQFELLKGNFLDEFYRSENEARQAMIQEEPDHDDNLPPRILPFLAAMVEKLCNDYHLACPEWVFSKRYYLDQPSFWMNAKGELRLVLLMESPVEFKMHNVFTTSDTLMRV